ncbi:NUDIX domain-containing protein [Candidatus Gracilibacteria bacterium]|nr:NUDIX domain-containing protein [Candidatus Gracilibacteria bacterium]
MQKPIEYINYYDREGKLLGTDERKKVLKRQEMESRETGDTNIVVNCIMLFLFDTNGQVYISKRANKPENPHLWDKSVGGHVVAGADFDMTVVAELDQELGVRADIVSDDQSLIEHIRNPIELTQKAVIKKIGEITNYKSKRTTREGDSWNKRMNVGLYIGIYNGGTNFKDGEVNNIELIPLTDLEKKINMNPEIYTDDILKLIKEHAVLEAIIGYGRKVRDILDKK